MTTNRDRVLQAMGSSLHPLDDDELSRRSGVTPRQTVNAICRTLEKQGTLRRFVGSGGKVVNQLLDGATAAANVSKTAIASTPGSDRDVLPAGLLSVGDSTEQRHAEALMLRALEVRLGVTLAPRRIVHPSGARVEIDGADEALGILVECWAHQGTAKVAQKWKLVVDATKLNWIAKSLDPAPSRLILCLSDRAAMSHLNGKSWQAHAIRDMGVEIAIVELGPEIVAGLAAAQKRQFR